MTTIIKKELRSYFVTMSGYIFIGLYVLATAIYFSVANVLSLYPDYSITLSVSNVLFLILIPVLTMGLFADEAKNKTDRLLFTSPLKINQIIIGKFLSAFILLLIAVLVTAIFPLALSAYGEIPITKIVGSYIGVVFLGCTFISVGLFVSVLSGSQIVAAISTFATLFSFYLFDAIVSVLPSSRISSLVFVCVVIVFLAMYFYSATKNQYVAIGVTAVCSFGAGIAFFSAPSLYEGLMGKVFGWFSVMKRFYGFTSGVLYVSDIVYYITFSLAFIFLTIHVMESRRRHSL